MKKIFRLLLLFCMCVLVSGCSTLTYVGEDYVPSNTQTVKTNEDFVFDVYKKNIGDVSVKIGISKTQIMEILALYVQIENYSYDTPYVFRVDDLRVFAKGNNVPFITSNNYLSVWQTQETASMAQMSSLGTTLTTMTGMMTNYEDFNQGVIQNSAQQTTNSAYSRMETLGNQILKHSTKTSSTISPRKSQYFYFFIEDKDEELTVKYKNLEYRFKV